MRIVALTLSMVQALVVALGSTSAHAEYPWSAIARQCGEMAAERMHEATGCASCADSWPSAALCTVNAYTNNGIDEVAVKRCIDKVWYARLRANLCNACGNPIDETIACLQKPHR
jgi:hypothetical protein